jgi:tRNA(Ile)-lysidine synthase
VTAADAAAELRASLFARCVFPSAPLTCAVSGGADSLALLVLATATGDAVTAIHVDHGLRPESGAEARVVRDAAARFGAAFRSERVVVAPGPNLEARAREARFAVLPPGTVTGHTLDDQAETVIVNLLRGSGLDGLAAMRSASHPLLALRRSETRALCAAFGLDPVNDPSNDDPSFVRNRVRHEVLPLLDEIAGRDVAAVLARQAAIARDEADFLDALVTIDAADARAVAGAPVVLARRAVRRWLADPYPPGAAATERVLAVARGDATACELEGGRRVRRSGQRLQVEN